MRKKGILFAICIVLNVYLSAETTKDYFKFLEGSWMDTLTLSHYNANRPPHIEHVNSEFKEIYFETCVFQFLNEFAELGYAFGTASPDVIYDISENEEKELVVRSYLTGRKYDEDNNSLVRIITNDKYKIRIRFLAKDEIQILDCGFDDRIWYKIDGPAVIPEKKAKSNDDRVRLRLKPNLNCQTLGYLNINDCVIIKDRSDNKFEIDGESWYWYKVDYPELPDGWIYGKYLTYISDKEYTNLLSEHEKKEKAKADALTKPEKRKLTKLEMLQKIDEVFPRIIRNANTSRGKDKDIVYNESKGIYKFKGNIITGKKDSQAIIINNEIFITDEIKIGMSETELRLILGTPDEINKNVYIYKEKNGKLCEYISSFYIEDGKVIKLVAQQVFFN